MDATLRGVRIAGLAACVPQNRENVLDSAYGTPETRQRFIRSTGIESRRRCLPDQFSSDLACASADRLLEELGWGREEIDVLVLVTQTPDFVSPATACLLQHRLGLGKHCAAFDVNLGCSAYPYGIQVAGSFLRTLDAGKALLLVADSAGKPNLPSGADAYAPLFGDAGSATALELDENAPPMRCQMFTDGSGWNVIMERSMKGRPGLGVEGFAYETADDGTVRIGNMVELDGEAVFNFSVRTVPPAVERLLADVGWEAPDVDTFVFHQANQMINKVINRKLSLAEGQSPSTLRRYGNTSCTTIPLTLVDQLREPLIQSRQRLVLCGFGIGLSWATLACETDGIVCPPLIEL